MPKTLSRLATFALALLLLLSVVNVFAHSAQMSMAEQKSAWPIEIAAKRRLVTGKRLAGSSNRLDRSGTWNGKDAWWIWVEGIRHVRSVKLDYSKD